MSLYMETTKIAPIKTAGEIEQLLIDAGAQHINKCINADRRITGLSWTMLVDGVLVPFQMPIRVKPVVKWLQAQRSPKTRLKMLDQDMEQAERVAWRQLLRWIQAQVAFISCGMVQNGEAFSSYIIGKDGRTMWEALSSNGGLKRLTGGQA